MKFEQNNRKNKKIRNVDRKIPRIKRARGNRFHKRGSAISTSFQIGGSGNRLAN